MEALAGYFVVDVACGSGDAQTLCITDNDQVWSWGDGDYGKLGRGGSEGCKEPRCIDTLSNEGIIKVGNLKTLNWKIVNLELFFQFHLVAFQ